MIKTTVVGSYPKVTESRADNLPGTMDRWQRQLANDAALEEEIQKVIRRVLREQEEAGIDLLTDGQVRWEDLPHPFARSVEGIERGALRRFFDNNVYYRRLEIPNGDVRWKKSAPADEFRFASSLTKRPIKVALPGPLTLVISTEPKADRQSREWLLSLYAGLLRAEVEALAAAGVKEIQIDEPAFQPEEPLLSKGIDAVNQIFNGVKARRWVACYFHDVSSILPTLAKLQVEVLSLDLVTGPKLLEPLQHGFWQKEIALGLVDGRNTKLESTDELARHAGKIAKSISPDRLWLSPNCGLEFLPHEAALKKLQLLREAAKKV